LSFKAVLEIEEKKKVRVLECDFGFNQHVDPTGKASGKPRGGIISLVIESVNDPELISWMFSHDERKNGTISFLRRDNEGPFKKVTFKEGICISYHETFRDYGTIPMTTALTISAREIKIGDVVFSNKWSSSEK
jgi:hypothetical protein